jgi:acid phosphatase
MMPIAQTLAASLAMASAAAAAQMLAPSQDINLPATGSATNPLEWLGANSPWFAGPDVYEIGDDIPENCYVQQVSYNVRHGSRYPDSGAYAGWVSMQERVGIAQTRLGSERES